MGYLYIIHEREFIKTNENVFKFGRTFDIFTRFHQYPKGSKLILSVNSNNPVAHERIILDALRTHFCNRRDIGAEYFECSLSKMISMVSRMSLVLNSQDFSDCKTLYKTVSTQTSDYDVQGNPFDKFKFRCKV